MPDIASDELVPPTAATDNIVDITNTPHIDDIGDIPCNSKTKRPKQPSHTEIDGICSIGKLTMAKRASYDLEHFKKLVAALPQLSVPDLIVRASTTTDALKLWAYHVHLTTRGVAPALRWPRNDSTPQMQFITWLADVLWFAKHNPEHHPKFRGWQRLLSESANTPEWLERAFWIFTEMYGRQNLSSYTARGLALTLEQRQTLMTLPTSRMAAARLVLSPKRFVQVRQCLLSHAHAHPDLSGQHSAQWVADRHAVLYRVAVLVGKSPSAIQKGWQLLTGNDATRQVLTRRLDAIKSALTDWDFDEDL